jgi:hypothetical protein
MVPNLPYPIELFMTWVNFLLSFPLPLELNTESFAIPNQNIDLRGGSMRPYCQNSAVCTKYFIAYLFLTILNNGGPPWLAFSEDLNHLFYLLKSMLMTFTGAAYIILYFFTFSAHYSSYVSTTGRECR